MYAIPSRLLAVSVGLFLIASARADDPQLPRRAPGLWEMTATWQAFDESGKEIADSGSSLTEFTSAVKQYCFDTATEAEEMAFTFTPPTRTCSALRSREGDTFVFQSDCTRQDPVTERTRTILKMRGNFASHYVTAILMETWSTEKGSTATRYVKRTGDIQARHIGERCPEGLMPGDIVQLPDGPRTTVSDRRKAVEGMQR